MKDTTYSRGAPLPRSGLGKDTTGQLHHVATSNFSCPYWGRLAEIVGLRLEDIDLENELIHIRPNSARRLKNKTSERVLPLVGYARTAMVQAMSQADDQWLFPQYIKAGHCYATHASNALNNWLKRDFGGLTAHSLRHTMRDRLRAVECPMDMIDQIGGWRSVGGVGASYGEGYGLEQQRMWLIRVSLSDDLA